MNPRPSRPKRDALPDCATPSNLAKVVGIEPTPTGLESVVLPLYYTFSNFLLLNSSLNSVPHQDFTGSVASTYLPVTFLCSYYAVVRSFRGRDFLQCPSPYLHLTYAATDWVHPRYQYLYRPRLEGLFLT